MGRSNRTPGPVRKRRKTNREVVDLLGYLVLWGWVLWYLLIYLSCEARLCSPVWVVVLGGVLAVVCCVRIALYRKTPKQERRVYRRMELFYGADQLVHPYPQSAYTIFFFAACAVWLLFVAGA